MSRHTPIYVRIFVVVAIIVAVAAYILYNSRVLIAGPKITIFEPQNYAEFDQSKAVVTGVTENTVFISINDRAISIDESGYFEEVLLLSPGYNIISIEAKDKFERTISQTLDLHYREAESEEDDFQIIKHSMLNPPPESATSTATSTEVELEEGAEMHTEENATSTTETATSSESL